MANKIACSIGGAVFEAAGEEFGKFGKPARLGEAGAGDFESAGLGVLPVRFVGVEFYGGVGEASWVFGYVASPWQVSVHAFGCDRGGDAGGAGEKSVG